MSQIPNPHVLTGFLIEYLISRQPEWNSTTSKFRSYYNDVKKQKTDLCIRINALFYNSEKKLKLELKKFDAWPNVISELGHFARAEDPKSALSDTIHAMRSYILDCFKEEDSCSVIQMDTLPKAGDINFTNPIYIRSDDKLFYHNKKHDPALIKINFTEEMKKIFDEKASPGKEEKVLSIEVLEKVEPVINHYHDKLTAHINSLIRQKFNLEEEIKDKKEDWKNAVTKNKSQNEVKNIETTINQLWDSYNTVVYQLIDHGDQDTILNALLEGAFDNMECLTQDDSTMTSELGIQLLANVPLVLQDQYYKFHYKKWCQPNTTVDFDTFIKQAASAEISIPQNRNAPVKSKLTRIDEATSSATGALSTVSSLITSFANLNISSSASSTVTANAAIHKRKFY